MRSQSAAWAVEIAEDELEDDGTLELLELELELALELLSWP